METTSFALGMLTIIVAGLLVVIGYTFYKVRKVAARLIEFQESSSRNFNHFSEAINRGDNELKRALNNDIAMVRSYLKEDVSTLYSHIDKQFDKRFDSFRKKLKTECFEDEKEDGKLYS